MKVKIKTPNFSNTFGFMIDDLNYREVVVKI